MASSFAFLSTFVLMVVVVVDVVYVVVEVVVFGGFVVVVVVPFTGLTPVTCSARMRRATKRPLRWAPSVRQSVAFGAHSVAWTSDWREKWTREPFANRLSVPPPDDGPTKVAFASSTSPSTATAAAPVARISAFRPARRLQKT